jgi:arylsulfatase A
MVDLLRKRNIEENTLVIFTSDNGPWYEGNPGVFRGREGQMPEGGFRVPFIARWPARIPFNAVCKAVAMNPYLFPTLCELAGLKLPEDRTIDGICSGF